MITKYRLKQLYPGSPYKVKVGDVVKTRNCCTGRNCGNRVILSKEHPFNSKTIEFEQHPNIWQKIK